MHPASESRAFKHDSHGAEIHPSFHLKGESDFHGDRDYEPLLWEGLKYTQVPRRG